MRATRSWSRRRAPSSRRWERGSSPRLRPGSASSCTDVAGLRIYETAILPEWIDYNGHLRDAYYTLIVSLASDALMDRLRSEEHTSELQSQSNLVCRLLLEKKKKKKKKTTILLIEKQIQMIIH